MNDQERYEDAVRQLRGFGYEILPDDQGDIVRCVTDHSDASRCHNLDQLIELADLFGWREQRLRPSLAY